MRRVLLVAILMPLAAVAATPFDGTYIGHAALNGGISKCDADIPFKIRIVDGAFTWKNQSDSTNVQVKSDGSFGGQLGQSFLAGQVSGPALTAKTQGKYCNYLWTFTRS